METGDLGLLAESVSEMTEDKDVFVYQYASHRFDLRMKLPAWAGMKYIGIFKTHKDAMDAAHKIRTSDDPRAASLMFRKSKRRRSGEFVTAEAVYEPTPAHTPVPATVPATVPMLPINLERRRLELKRDLLKTELELVEMDIKFQDA
jgi:hypothetical protein